MAKSKTLSFFKSREFLIFSIVSLVFTIFVFTSLPRKMDYRIYDFLLMLHKAPKESKEILFVNVDDESINAMGEWPWSRDILADSLIRMKELGASKAIFDIEYLSPSPKGAMPNSEHYIENAFVSVKEDIKDVINEFSTSVARGYVARGDVPRVSNEMIQNYITPSLTELEESIGSNIYRDNDEYFARALQFFGDAWLTINTRDVSITLSKEDKLYAEERMLLKNVSDPKKFVLQDNRYTKQEQYVENEMGFSPALNMLLRRANGAGFTNVIIDTDGIRRRIELLYDYGDKFLAQLSFAPLLNVLDAQSLERNRFSLVVKGALFPGKTEREDIRIPLDGHGRMCINWQHKEQGSSFRNESVLFLKELDSIEESIVTLLSNISANEIRSSKGEALSYVGEAKSLLNDYDEITNAKEYLLEKCLGYDIDGSALGQITEQEYEEYFSMRNNFFAKVNDFLSKEHLNSIGSRAEELLKANADTSAISEFVSLMENQFEILKESYELYSNYFSEMKEVYSGSICFLGNTASSTTDLGTNPFVRSYPNVGTHANVMNTILQKAFITPLPREIGFFVVVFLLFFATMLTHKSSDTVHNSTIVILSLAIIVSIVCAFIFASIYIPLFTILLFIIANFIASLSYRLLLSSNERRFIKNAFSTYLSASVVDELLESPDKLQLGGETRNISALFTDIKSFSSMSELVTPQELVAILNEYLGELSDKILEYNGTIDKYIGDAIVSFFGAPIALPDHAYRACSAAIRMKQVEKIYNERHKEAGDVPMLLETRIGINTGDMLVGNMGTDIKMNYTVLGNNVNLASRLEGVNKIYKSWILASEQTWEEANSGEHKGELVSRRLDKVRVVGINKPVQLYNIIGFKNELKAEKLAEIDQFHEALDKYLEKDFEKAQKLFLEAHRLDPSDETALIFAERCKTYFAQGVKDDWDGVMNMTTK